MAANESPTFWPRIIGNPADEELARAVIEELIQALQDLPELMGDAEIPTVVQDFLDDAHQTLVKLLDLLGREFEDPTTLADARREGRNAIGGAASLVAGGARRLRDVATTGNAAEFLFEKGQALYDLQDFIPS